MLEEFSQQSSNRTIDEKRRLITKQISLLPQGQVSDFLVQVTRQILAEEQPHDQFELICFAFEQPNAKGIQISVDNVLGFIRKCETLLQMATLFKQSQLKIQQSNKTFRDRLRAILEDEIEMKSFYTNMLIPLCMSAKSVEQITYYATRIRALLRMLLTYSDDMHVFSFIFEPIVKAFLITLNTITLKQGSQRNETNEIADLLYSSIDQEKNLYFWHVLIDIILETARYPDKPGQLVQPNLVASFIMRKIPTSYFSKMFEYIGEYIFKIKPFHEEREVLQIIESLTKYGITAQSLELIHLFCNQIAQDQGSFILLEVFKVFILNQLPKQASQTSIRQQYVQLLSMFFVGVSSGMKDLVKNYTPQLEEIFSRLNIQISSLKLIHDEDPKQIWRFLQLLNELYPQMKTLQSFKLLQEGLKTNYPNLQSERLKTQLSQQIWDFNYERNNQIQKSVSQPIGIRNMINTCYFNSFIQSLFYTPDFRDLILGQPLTKQEDVRIYLSQGDSLVVTLQKMFAFLEYVNKEVDFCPVQFKLALREPYRNMFQQQDASEFGLQLLDDLSTQLGRGDQAKLKSQFIGNSRNMFTCESQSCKKDTVGPIEEFSQLSLHFPETKSYGYSMISSSYGRRSVKELINQYQKVEEIQMTCDYCKKESNCQKKPEIISLPKYLIVVVNRFQYQNQIKTKITTSCSLDFQIKIKDKQYELYSFIVHIGQDADHGHYVSYAREQDTNYWYMLDDSYTQTKPFCDEDELSRNFVLNNTPYILFYKQRL